MDEMLKKAQAGGSVVDREKVWTLAFAADLVIVAKSEREMKVNVQRTKMLVFNKRKRKNEENEWNWERRKTEQVNEFKDLGYTFKERATDEAHIIEIVRKGNKVVGCVWGIEERKWRGEFRRSMMMFQSLIESILMYGAAIWGWKEPKEVEESARKIFEMGARSRQRNARLHSEERVQEEYAGSESGQKSGKV
jgi:hypothetical protein